MHTTLLSLPRRAALLSCGTFFAVTLITACESDRPLAPSKAVPAPAAQASPLYRGPSLSWIILEENNARVPVAGSTFSVTGPKVVVDNGAGDSNPNVGEVLMTGIAPGNYMVCQTAAAPGFMPQGNPPCLSTIVGSGAASVGPFFNPRPPKVVWGLTDEVGNYLAGSQFGVADSLGTFGVNDNGPHDTDPLTAMFGVKLWDDGEFTLCQKWAPPGFVLPAAEGCTKFLAHYGLTTQMGLRVNVRPYSANWGVTDGNLDASNNYVPLAGAKFKVTYPYGLGSINVDDNGQNDYDTRPGRLAVKLPASGSYLICETQAPPNHWIPQRSCATRTVAYAVPASAGWFVNYEAQVPSFLGER